ncbi:excinuclease ABC, C subunit [Candidatus Magnetobacterium bavaricum]|uniref:UvrABC system protein C n=1 Tax=Candidatus Magnetobacterium bavaricum TaxID=29290 RepID=A0A0F3GZL7_9BACT|nr:excinuclease ABC, C subunit [Candidatus Magnetobacterium bavaricum]
MRNYSQEFIYIALCRRIVKLRYRFQEDIPFIHMLEKLETVPNLPGVYMFRDARERVLYVGKAINLKGRIRSYFHRHNQLDLRKSTMMTLVANFSFIVTDNEVEALALEANLIKQYRPKFNVILKDDKNYPYIRLTVTQQWPKLEISRKLNHDGDIYIGPYVSSRSMRETLEFVKRCFPLRTCKYKIENLTRACLQYQIGQCSAPCVGLITKEAYDAHVRDCTEFLKGARQDLLDRLKRRMYELSDDLLFEEAARYRDKIRAIEGAWEMQKVVAQEFGDIDVIGFYRPSEGDIAAEGIALIPSAAVINVFFIRNSLLIGVKDFFFRDTQGLPYKELIHSFIMQFYNKEILPPAEIIVRKNPSRLSILRKWLSKRRTSSVNITTPYDKKRSEVLTMADNNAATSFKLKLGLSDTHVLEELTARLGLPQPPESIGAFDISTISGDLSVGAFIYWAAGGFKKHLYRHVRVKTVSGQDDYAMMREVVLRITGNLKGNFPDLVVIDGGKGQLDSAMASIDELVGAGIPIRASFVALAKDPDRVFIPGRDGHIGIDDSMPSSLLLRRIRDEVHRFAITFHRKLREKKFLQSPLEKIKGVTRQIRLELLKHFVSIEAIKNATTEEIASLDGLNKRLATNILKALKGEEK